MEEEGEKTLKKTGYIGILDGIKKQRQEKKTFTLLYDKEKPVLYSYAKILIGDRVIATDKAMWDTGATITAISHSAAKNLDTTPSDTGTSISATDRSDSDIYLATLELPGGIVFHDVEVWDVDLSDHGAEVVIGMDIISRGRFIVETVNGIPMFSFSIEQ